MQYMQLSSRTSSQAIVSWAVPATDLSMNLAVWLERKKLNPGGLSAAHFRGVYCSLQIKILFA